MSARISTAWATSAVQDCYYNQTPMGKYVTQNNMTRLGLETPQDLSRRAASSSTWCKVYQQANKLKTNPACRKPCLDKGTVISRGRSCRPGSRCTMSRCARATWCSCTRAGATCSSSSRRRTRLYNSGEARHRQVTRRSGSPRRRWSRSAPTPGRSRSSRSRTRGCLRGPPDAAHRQRHPHHRERQTDRLAAEAQSTGRATFFVNMTVPKAVGLTGNFVGIEAIR